MYQTAVQLLYCCLQNVVTESQHNFVKLTHGWREHLAVVGGASFMTMQSAQVKASI